MADPYAHSKDPAPVSPAGKHDRHACPIYKKTISPCKDCLPAYSSNPEPDPEPMCKNPEVAPSKMPEPTGEFANVPPGWPPQTWGAHLACIAWMTAMGRGHYSFTEPKRHIKAYTKKILEEERLRVIKILREAHVGNMDVERKIYPEWR
jgi:hypothetical protein